MAKIKGVNSTALKKQNRISILSTLKNKGSLSRKDLAQIINLTPAAVTIITNEMIEEGILIEKGTEQGEQNRAGRKKVLIDINENFKCILAVNITKNKVYWGVYNLKGNLIDKEKIDMNLEISPKLMIENISRECMRSLWINNFTKEQVLGVGVSVVGGIDKKKGISKKAFGLWREEVPIKEYFEETLDVEVVVENNVRALALAESEMFENEKNSDFLFIKYGPGIGSALFLNKKIHYGKNYLAGEIGHINMVANGEKCPCGKRGCLETIASEESIITQLNKNNFDMDLINIIENYPNIKQSEKNIIDKSINYLAIAINNIITFVDINKIVIYGHFFDNEALLNKLRDVLISLSGEFQESLSLERSLINKKDMLIGSYTTAMRELFYERGGM